MATYTEKKLAEGYAYLHEAEKCMKTSLFKWKPDVDGALAEYTKAATAFKNAKSYDNAASSYIKASDLQYQSGSAFHSAKSMESAALVYKEAKQLGKAADLVEKASFMYLEHGTPDTAAIALDRAAKMIEGEMPERAIELYYKACDVSENEDRPQQCAELIGKAARLLIRTKRLEEALKALKKECEYYAAAENRGLLNKLVMAIVLLQLHLGDYVAADQAFQGCLSYSGFAQTDEAVQVEQLLEAYDQCDQEAADRVLRSPLFKYMENDFTKLARDLRVPGNGKPSAPGGATNTDATQPEDEDDEFAGGLL